MRAARINLLASLLLLAVAALPYAGLWRQEFVNFDDTVFVTKNEQVNKGLTAAGLRYAFGINKHSQYHPLTWLSHMTDVQLFGVHAGPMKLHNLLLHLGSTLLLFHLARRLTGHVLGAAALAAIWSVHPLRVEAVAWVAERKEVLCAFFGLLTLHAYVSYVRRPGAGRFTAVFILYALALMAKPMLVTLPCVMLLLDLWPLRRGEPSLSGEAGRRWIELAWEKAPLMLLVAVSSYMTILCQRAAGALVALDDSPIMMRVAGSFTGAVWYVRSLFFPTRLTVLYPRPEELAVGEVAVGVALVVVLSWLAWRAARTQRWAFVGWFGFLGMLVPVIGLVQVGAQAYADRYTYMTHMLLLAGLIAAVGPLWRNRAPLVAALAVAIVAVSVSATWRQVKTWENSGTLWERNLDFFPMGVTAHNNMGVYENQKANAAEGELRSLHRASAVLHYRIAAMLRPSSDGGINLGILLNNIGRYEDAERTLLQYLRARPGSVSARINMGVTLWSEGRLAEAAEEFDRALQIDPGSALALENRELLSRDRKNPEARRAALERASGDPSLRRAGRVRLAGLFLDEGDAGTAAMMLKLVLAEEPGRPDAVAMLGRIVSKPVGPDRSRR
ncbi:MAG: tetratricopeptide repeat protein [Planctomycetes bacterium]|nr:tetratricopeptide repeat protein [Planctomycetota bacterium]